MPQKSGTVKVGQGMTLYSIAKANNVSVSKLASFDGLKPPYAVHEGQVLRVPGVSTAMTPDPAPVQQQVARAEEPQAAPKQVAKADEAPFKKKSVSGARIRSPPVKRSIRLAANMACRPSPSPT